MIQSLWQRRISRQQCQGSQQAPRPTCAYWSSEHSFAANLTGVEPCRRKPVCPTVDPNARDGEFEGAMAHATGNGTHTSAMTAPARQGSHGRRMQHRLIATRSPREHRATENSPCDYD